MKKMNLDFNSIAGNLSITGFQWQSKIRESANTLNIYAKKYEKQIR